MKNIDKELIDWAIKKIETEFKDEVCLLIGRKGACKIPTDGNEVAFDFFIPACDHGYNLAETFIIDDMGYDLFPMSWERVEGIANINESITFCLADGVILYARSDEDRERFIKLQQELQNNLKNKNFIYDKALEKVDNAMELFKVMIFEESLSYVRKGAVSILGYLTEAIATANSTYLRKGAESQINALKAMKHIPKNYISLFESVINAKTVDEIKDLSYKVLEETRKFFSNDAYKNSIYRSEYNFEDLAGWYEEGKYTWRRIYYFCDHNEAENCLAWGNYLQIEFDIIKEDFGLKTMDLLGVFDSNDLTAFKKRAEELEKYIISEIESHGVKIKSYKDLNEFLEYHG